MKRGSIVIDLAGSTGGNVTLSQLKKKVERNGVVILARQISRDCSGARQPALLAQRHAFLTCSSRTRTAYRHGRHRGGPACVTHEGKW